LGVVSHFAHERGPPQRSPFFRHVQSSSENLLLIRKRHKWASTAVELRGCTVETGFVLLFAGLQNIQESREALDFSIWLAIQDLRAYMSDGMRSANEDHGRFLHWNPPWPPGSFTS
jgi:hypothetical protein